MIKNYKRIIMLRQIKTKRHEMYQKAKQFGYTHPEVVTCSQELDTLLNEYQNMLGFNNNNFLA